MISHKNIIAVAAFASVLLLLSVPTAFAVNDTTSSVFNSGNTATTDLTTIDIYNDAECQSPVSSSGAFNGFYLKYDVTVNNKNFTYTFHNSDGVEEVGKILYMKSNVSGTVTSWYDLTGQEGGKNPVVTVTSLYPDVTKMAVVNGAFQDDRAIQVSSASPSNHTGGTTFSVEKDAVYKIEMKGTWNNAKNGTITNFDKNKSYLDNIQTKLWIPGFDCGFEVTSNDVTTSVSNSSNVFSFRTNVEIATEVVQPESPGSGQGDVTGESETISGTEYPVAQITYDEGKDSAVSTGGSDYNITISGDSRFVIYLEATGGRLGVFITTTTTVKVAVKDPDTGDDQYHVDAEAKGNDTVKMFIAMDDGGADQWKAYTFTNDNQKASAFASAKAHALDGDGSAITLNINGDAATGILKTGSVTMKIYLVDEILH